MQAVSPLPEPRITLRLQSLDFVRGLTMVLLTLESTRLYEHLEPLAAGTAAAAVLRQFFHHPWHGLRVWDLVQPVFMFVAGAALAFSMHRYLAEHSWPAAFGKVLKRCGWLFFWGVLDYAVRPGGLSFELWDVLTQLSFTTLVAFLLMRFGAPVQIAGSLFCLLLPELLYRFAGVPRFDQPFTDQHNFGNYVDWLLMRKINPGGWVAINCISTSAHTIWGVLAGQLLLKKSDGLRKLRLLVFSGVLLLVLGYGLDWLELTPIIKRIATSSFVLVSGGWCLLFLALAYWWIDVRQHRRGLFFFTLFGMNALFIYLFFEIVAARWFNDWVLALTSGLFALVHLSGQWPLVAGSLVIFSLEAALLYFLYRKNIFFKI